MSSTRVAITVAAIGAVGAIVAALIQKDGPAKTEAQFPPVQVNPQIQMSPQIVINPQMQLAPQVQSHQSISTQSPPRPSDGEGRDPPMVKSQYRITGFTPEDTAQLTASLHRLHLVSADVSLLDAARAGGKNVSINVVQADGHTYEDQFGVSGTNVVPVITRHLSENLEEGAR